MLLPSKGVICNCCSKEGFNIKRDNMRVLVDLAFVLVVDLQQQCLAVRPLPHVGQGEGIEDHTSAKHLYSTHKNGHSIPVTTTCQLPQFQFPQVQLTVLLVECGKLRRMPLMNILACYVKSLRRWAAIM